MKCHDMHNNIGAGEGTEGESSSSKRKGGREAARRCKKSAVKNAFSAVITTMTGEEDAALTFRAHFLWDAVCEKRSSRADAGTRFVTKRP